MTLSVLGKWYLLWPYQSPNATKIGAWASTRENPKWHFWLQKCHFGKGPRKGLYYLWYTKAVLIWKQYFYSVFSKPQLCRDERVQVEQKHNLPKIGGCLPTCKVFLSVFGALAFFSLFWFFFCFGGGEVKERQFSWNFIVFFLFVPPKGLSLQPFSSSYSFFSFLSVCLPFQNSIFFFDFCPSTLFGKHSLFLVLLSFFFGPFPFLMFACCFEANYPNIPFFIYQLVLIVGCLYVVAFVLVFMLMFLIFYLYWLCFWYAFLLLLFCSCCVSCVAFRLWTKRCFPCNSSVVWVMLVRG